MAFCRHCGAEIDDKAVVCIHCGYAVGSGYYGQSVEEPEKDIPLIALKIVSFLLPVVGLILFLVYIDSMPVSARAYGRMALISVCVDIAVSVIIILLFAVFISRML